VQFVLWATARLLYRARRNVSNFYGEQASSHNQFPFGTKEICERLIVNKFLNVSRKLRALIGPFWRHI
jgi:hypothetical protein